MSDNPNNVVWLTQEAHDALQAELDHLKSEGREEVAARISSARDEGDLKENAGYHAAREEQGQMESRIRQLEQLLRDARVGAAEGATDEVAPGKIVTVAFNGDENDTDTFLLGSREVLGTDSSVQNAVSPQSPLGAAVLGGRVGDKVTYKTPTGKDLSVTITQIKTS